MRNPSPERIMEAALNRQQKEIVYGTSDRFFRHRVRRTRRPALNKTPDSIDTEPAILNVAEAKAIAEDNPDEIWLEVSEADYYGEPKNMTPER